VLNFQTQDVRVVPLLRKLAEEGELFLRDE